MKKFLFVIFAVLLLTVAMSVTAFAAEIDGVYYDLDAKNQVATVNTENRTSTTENVVIPSEIEFEGVTYKVTKIANDAFYGNKTVKTLMILSEHITAIPVAMIANTYDGALEKIYIDFSKIVTIGGAAFNPSAQTNGNNPVRNNFYYYDAKAYLESGEDVIITDPDFSNCTSIGAAAFQGANFEKLTIPAAVYLNNQIFRSSAIKELVIEGEDRTTIEYYVFQDCKQLERIVIKSRNLNSISNDVFSGCYNVKEIYIDLSKCNYVKACAFTFSTAYDRGNTTTQWYNLEGEKGVDLSSMKILSDRSFSSSNLGSAKITWPTALEKIEDQAFRKCNINQPMLINAAEGATVTLPYWCFEGNSPTLLVCNEGVVKVEVKLSGTVAVFLAPSINITNNDGSFIGGSTLYCKGFADGSKLPNESKCTTVIIESGSIENYGACGIVATVTNSEGDVVLGEVSHDTDTGIDNTLCPVGKVTVTACKFCDFAEYTIDGEAAERKEHTFDFENGEIGSIVYNNYFEKGFKSVLCADCAATQALDEATEGALFISKGISAKTFGDTIGLVQGYELNRNAINLYKSFNSDFDFGILAYANVGGGAVAPKPGENKVVDITFNNMANDYIEVMLTSIPDDCQDVKLVFCIYATKGDCFYYLDDGVMSDTVVGKSYNEVVE